MTSHVFWSAAVGAVIAAFLLSAPGSAQAAESGLMERVNDAILEAGAPLTVERSNAFQVGVFVGHYLTYKQLVGAIIFQKEKGALPTFSSPKKAAPPVTKCIVGNVVSLSDNRITIKGNTADGADKTIAMNIKSNQYKIAVHRGALAGSGKLVKACSKDNFANLHSHVTIIP